MGCERPAPPASGARYTRSMTDPILEVRPLGFPWQCSDPFLFCAHHDDAYPAGNEQLGPTGSLAGRELGQDFTVKDGFRMYHGRVVPGFPQHPHRGFETVTIVRRGYVDHSDSLGATARFGQGDVQWLTAGSGIVHSEMFPLLSSTESNPLELFQIWLNLPASDKLAPPHFAMLWNQAIPRLRFSDAAGRRTELTIIAGAPNGQQAPAPPPHSWAARASSQVAIWTIRLEPGASWQLPAAEPGLSRSLYFFRGRGLQIGERSVPPEVSIGLRSQLAVNLTASEVECELLLLQGRPIAEPVTQYGPFVMNTRAEIQAAFADFQRTRFGGWPFGDDDPVHPREAGRFAKRSDGTIERGDDDDPKPHAIDPNAQSAHRL
jgi:redox-sensitive bicupin YhaK (pirin superfamily)